MHFQIRLAKSAVVSEGLGLADNDVWDKIIAVLCVSDVKVNVSAAVGNALILKDDGLYVPTPKEVDISGKADKVTGATTGNFAALDGEGNLTDSGKKPADFVGAEAGKRLMSDAEGEKLAGVSEGATKTAASSTNGNVNIDGKEVVVYTEPENVLHDEDVEDFSAEEIAALLADAG